MNRRPKSIFFMLSVGALILVLPCRSYVVSSPNVGETTLRVGDLRSSSSSSSSSAGSSTAVRSASVDSSDADISRREEEGEDATKDCRETRTRRNSNDDLRDRRTVSLHLLSCLASAAALCRYEDLDCAYLKPETTTLRASATRGLGAARSGESDVGDASPPYYNDVLRRHRDLTVPRWRRQQRALSDDRDVDDATAAATVVYDALASVERMKESARDYDWDDMRVALAAPLLNEELDRACTTLRVRLSRTDDGVASDEIGFHWGSCAWRHCGALADAQEAVSYLSASLGLFEPFECLFCLDVVERSLRDVIAVVPPELRPRDRILPSYARYQPQSGPYDDGYRGVDPGEVLAGDKSGGGGGTETLDQEYLTALSDLRVDLSLSKDDGDNEE